MFQTKLIEQFTSSIPATAIIKVGIPLATPYPFVLSLKRQGTTTAGDTAAIIDPNKSAHIQGSPKK